MTQAIDLSLQPVLNIRELLTRVDNDRELLLELIAIGKDQIPHYLCQLREAVAQADVERIAKLGHTMKGMLLGLAATPAAAAATRLEQLGHSGETSSLTNAAELLEGEVAKLMTELEAYLASAHDEDSGSR